MSFIVNPYQFAAAAATDPNWSNVSLLLHMDGSNGSTTFTDSSSNAFAMTAVGTAQVSTSSPKFGTGSMTVTDNTGTLKTGTLSASGPLDLSTGDLTIEFFLKCNTIASHIGFCSWGNSYPASYGGEIWSPSGGGFRINKDASTAILDIGAGAVVADGAWRHYAVTRSGNTWRAFKEGTLLGSATSSSGLDFVTSGFFISDLVTGALRNTNYIDEFRVTKGVARYTASFTAPTAAFPNS